MGVEVELIRIALMKQQVIDWKLPPAPAKVTDSRTASWTGLGQVELDAVDPKKIQSMCEDAILDLLDSDLEDDLRQVEDVERVSYNKALKQFISTL